MCRHFESVILTIAMTCTLAAGQQRPQPPARTTPSPPQAQQAPLIDRDVIQMVESGKPEAAIVASIRSSRTNFDLSPQGCRLLAGAHVSRTILNAMGNAGQPPCTSAAETSKPQTNAGGTLLGNGNPTLLGDGSVHAPPGGMSHYFKHSDGSHPLNPQPLPPRTAANSGAASPGANVAQATAAVSDYRQPPGNKVPSGRNGVPSGRVLLRPGDRPAGPQQSGASAPLKTTAPVGMVKAQPGGSAPMGPGQTLSAQNPSTSPTNPANRIAPAATNVRPAMAAAAHYPGTIEGYVFWDSHWGGGYCGFITITVSVEKSPNVYTSLGTLGNISEYVGTVKYQEPGVSGSVTVCKYAYTNVPLEQDLQVQIDLGAFSLSVYPSHPTVGPINIPKTSSVKCRMSSSQVAKPSLSQTDLDTHWELCASTAYKVNFVTSPNVWI
jgi:hypothetical protein